MIEAGANPKSVNWNLRTPLKEYLHKVKYNGNLDVIRFLLKCNVSDDLILILKLLANK